MLLLQPLWAQLVSIRFRGLSLSFEHSKTVGMRNFRMLLLISRKRHRLRKELRKAQVLISSRSWHADTLEQSEKQQSLWRRGL
jgi:hypothetical protein